MFKMYVKLGRSSYATLCYFFISLLCSHCLLQAQSDDEGLKEEDGSSSKEEKQDEEGKEKTEVHELISLTKCLLKD